VPVCFAVLGARTLAFAIDDKPKAAGRTPKRLRNLDENPRFALVADRWSESWRRLGYVLVSGTASRARDVRRRAAAVRALRARYPQYVAMDLDAGRHEVLLLAIERVHAWGRITVPARAR
jgi:PPOX class probable F420-dependent enzyme